jgi:hypothetical protein
VAASRSCPSRVSAIMGTGYDSVVSTNPRNSLPRRADSAGRASEGSTARQASTVRNAGAYGVDADCASRRRGNQ